MGSDDVERLGSGKGVGCDYEGMSLRDAELARSDGYIMDWSGQGKAR